MWSDNETDLDLLGFQHLTSAVCAIIRNDALLPATIGVFGDWGSGKSSLLQMVRAELKSNHDCLVLSFNGWLFEGYDDAKSALMGTIVDEIVAQRSTLSTVTDKARGIAVRLLKKIQLFRVLTVGAKAAGAFSVGGWPAAAASLAIDGAAVGQQLKAKYDELVDGASDVTVEDLGSYLKSDRSQAVRRTVREFRDDFAALLREMEIKRLVVLIDDLDRCMPDTIIETLEAIKLFLYVPRTAFVLGADERLVRYAVRRRFPELPGEKSEVGRDYLEKLVQFPIRVPPLGRAEMETYINLLFARKALTKPEEFEAARKCVVDCLPDSLLEVRYNHGIAEKALGRALPKDLSEDLALAQKIAPVLATGLVGNPRQCKRFLNTLAMRTEMAKGRGIELKQRVLAKLMLLEYFRPESFRALAEAQALQSGKSRELFTAEMAMSKRYVAGEETAGAGKGKKSIKKDPIEIPAWLTDAWIGEWLAIEPLLADEDLRKYFYFSRDALGPMASAVQRMSPLAQSILTELAQESGAVRQNALKRAQSLGVGDAAAIFEALAEKARVEEDSHDERSYLGQLCLWTIERSELSAQAVTFLGTLPIEDLPIWVVTKILAFQAVDKEHVRSLLVKWSQGSNLPLKGAATAKLKNL